MENNSNINNNFEEIRKEETQENQETQENNETQENHEIQEQKRGRGRPKGSKSKSKKIEQNFDEEFEKDFQIFNTQQVEEEEENFLTTIDLKNQLLFLDNFICLLIEKIFKKKISRMEESEAEFIASLAPQDLSLLKPSKTTFYTVLAAYYLSKALF